MSVPASEHRVILLRHGETAWSKEKRHTGRSDIPLTEAGVAQARAAGERLAGVTVDHVLVSPLVRARQTCELAGSARARSSSRRSSNGTTASTKGRTSARSASSARLVALARRLSRRGGRRGVAARVDPVVELAARQPAHGSSSPRPPAARAGGALVRPRSRGGRAAAARDRRDLRPRARARRTGDPALERRRARRSTCADARRRRHDPGIRGRRRPPDPTPARVLQGSRSLEDRPRVCCGERVVEGRPGRRGHASPARARTTSAGASGPGAARPARRARRPPRPSAPCPTRASPAGRGSPSRCGPGMSKASADDVAAPAAAGRPPGSSRARGAAGAFGPGIHAPRVPRAAARPGRAESSNSHSPTMLWTPGVHRATVALRPGNGPRVAVAHDDAAPLGPRRRTGARTPRTGTRRLACGRRMYSSRAAVAARWSRATASTCGPRPEIASAVARAADAGRRIAPGASPRDRCDGEREPRRTTPRSVKRRPAAMSPAVMEEAPAGRRDRALDACVADTARRWRNGPITLCRPWRRGRELPRRDPRSDGACSPGARSAHVASLAVLRLQLGDLQPWSATSRDAIGIPWQAICCPVDDAAPDRDGRQSRVGLGWVG